MLTGLTGFKGTWLAAWLDQLGADVRGLSLAPTPEMDRGWPELNSRFHNDVIDVRDANEVAKAFAGFQPEIVFHLAAQPLVRLSYDQPIETFATNVLGTVHVLEAARHTASVRAVVNVTSDKCYENREWHWAYREDEPVGGHDPYSASKGCSELVTAAYQRSYGQAGKLPIASARAGNVIGGGDWAAERLVPDLVRSIMDGQPLIIRRPEALRPWQHVLEPLSGYLTLAAALIERGNDVAEAWNFGPHDSETMNVRELAKQLIESWGKGEVVEQATPTGPHEAHYLKLDSSKAGAILGWKPLLTNAERVAWTVDWYKAWQEDPTSIWDMTLQQINAYEQKVARCLNLAPHWSPASTDSSAPHSPAV